MFIFKSFDLDLVPGEKPPKIRVSQFDIGRDFGARLFNNGDTYTIESEFTAKVEGSLGRYGFTEPAVIDSNYNMVTFTLTEAMTAVEGPVWCKIKLEKGDISVSSCAFILDVNRAAVDPSVIIGAPGFEQQIKNGVNDYIDAHPEVYEKVNMFRGQITSGSLNDYRDNGWWVIATDDRPNISDVPDGANNICYLFSYTTGTGATYQIFRTVFGQEWTRRITSSGSASAWRQAGYSSSITVEREKFVETMNRKAAQLGMQDTLYDNPDFTISTPPNSNYTSVMDMLRLAVASSSSAAFKRYSGLESATIYTGNTSTPTLTFMNLLADPSREVGSLFAQLKALRFTVIGAKTGSRTKRVEDTINNIICVVHDDDYDETYAIAILDADTDANLFWATKVACLQVRELFHPHTTELPPNTEIFFSEDIKAVAGCRIISDSPYFGNSFKNVDCGFLIEEGVEKDFTTGLAEGESVRSPYIQVSASIIKVMILLVAEETIGNWNAQYQITHYDSTRGGSGAGLQEGDILSLNDLAIYMLLRSSNQSACSIATYCGGKMLYSNYSGR